MARFDPHNPKSLQQLLDEADARLYEDKRSRKASMMRDVSSIDSVVCVT